MLKPSMLASWGGRSYLHRIGLPFPFTIAFIAFAFAKTCKHKGVGEG